MIPASTAGDAPHGSASVVVEGGRCPRALLILNGRDIEVHDVERGWEERESLSFVVCAKKWERGEKRSWYELERKRALLIPIQFRHPESTFGSFATPHPLPPPYEDLSPSKIKNPVPGAIEGLAHLAIKLSALRPI